MKPPHSLLLCYSQHPLDWKNTKLYQNMEGNVINRYQISYFCLAQSKEVKVVPHFLCTLLNLCKTGFRHFSMTAHSNTIIQCVTDWVLFGLSVLKYRRFSSSILPQI